MFNPGGTAASRQYRQINVRHEIETASPHRLIQLMMERVITKIGIARGHMQRKDVNEKGIHIGDAISIINGLQASLNHKPNSRLAGNFDALYDYMTRRLLEANITNSPEILNEVVDLMREMKEAWDAIAPEVAASAVAS
jgi:flagellar protein FliS